MAQSGVSETRLCLPLSRRLSLPSGRGMRAGEHGLGNAARTGHHLVYSAVCSIASHLSPAGSVKSDNDASHLYRCDSCDCYIQPENSRLHVSPLHPRACVGPWLELPSLRSDPSCVRGMGMYTPAEPARTYEECCCLQR
jgi:hypothetical protein